VLEHGNTVALPETITLDWGEQALIKPDADEERSSAAFGAGFLLEDNATRAVPIEVRAYAIGEGRSENARRTDGRSRTNANLFETDDAEVTEGRRDVGDTL
jgi:hypothetical protein